MRDSQLASHRRTPTVGPTLSLKERDRRWAGLRHLMAEQDLDAIVVGSFQGRERLESYLIDDFLDSVVVFPIEKDPTILTFSTARASRIFESERRGIQPWASDVRIGFGGVRVAAILREKGLPKQRVGLVGMGPTAGGEAEGLVPYGFYKNLSTALRDVEVVDFTRDFMNFIHLKSDEEIALIRFAAGVSEQACLAMIDACRPGVSEAEVYAEILHEIHRWGCDTRYPFLSLQSGPDNISWGAPRWTVRAEAPRILQRGDLVQAEIHTLYGGQESQVQMCVALDPVDDDIHTCEAVARRSYEAGLASIRPGIIFSELFRAMEQPLEESGCWSKTPLAHTMNYGAWGFSAANREQLINTREEALEVGLGPDALLLNVGLELKEGMALELEPNACLGMKRVNIGGIVLVTASGVEELNQISTRVYHAG
ncbi:aminopeptidase P family protein [Pusillimonas caeni]|uniref:M24 family metallopeptidase n=1 Tax=Pusillimonas caeni TaxID=1348472 RepID=UPI000E59D83B|nr:M24 family metallopeptidase [Pusillimonas caeni]TFL15529.1 aminopeptidase P family protein [Pusillimonas caeni]